MHSMLTLIREQQRIRNMVASSAYSVQRLHLCTLQILVPFLILPLSEHRPNLSHFLTNKFLTDLYFYFLLHCNIK